MVTLWGMTVEDAFAAIPVELARAVDKAVALPEYIELIDAEIEDSAEEMALEREDMEAAADEDSPAMADEAALDAEAAADAAAEPALATALVASPARDAAPDVTAPTCALAAAVRPRRQMTFLICILKEVGCVRDVVSCRIGALGLKME